MGHQIQNLQRTRFLKTFGHLILIGPKGIYTPMVDELLWLNPQPVPLWYQPHARRILELGTLCQAMAMGAPCSQPASLAAACRLLRHPFQAPGMPKVKVRPELEAALLHAEPPTSCRA